MKIHCLFICVYMRACVCPEICSYLHRDIMITNRRGEVDGSKIWRTEKISGTKLKSNKVRIDRWQWMQAIKKYIKLVKTK